MPNRIVVCPEPLAAAAGAEIFRAGGSAIDAALATAYAQAVISPAMTSIAGSGVMNVYHAPSGRNVIIDFLDQAGSQAREKMFADRPPGEILFGYKSMLIPTFVRGTQVAFDEFGSGRVTWQSLLEPAIRYAEQGFTIYPYLHQYWRADNPVLQTSAPFDGYRMLATTPACADIFTRQGRVPHIGERLVQADLARTLRRIAVEGPDDFYTGQTGRTMAADLERTLSELRAERDRVTGLLDDRRQLVASASHELRTPVATVRGYLESALARPEEVPAGFRGVLRIASDSPIAVTALETRYNELDHFLMASTLAVPEDYAPASSELNRPPFSFSITA